MPAPPTSAAELAPAHPDPARRAFLRRGLAASLAGAAAVAAVRPSAALAATADYAQPGTFTAPQTFAPSTDDVAVTVQGASGQTRDLQQWKDAGGSVLARIDASGALQLGDIPIRQVSPGHLGIGASTIVNGALVVRRRDDAINAPEMHFEGANGTWYMGIDVANQANPAADFFIAKVTDGGKTVNDTVYIAHNGASPPTMGVGVTPPDKRYTLQVSGSDVDPTVGGLSIRVPPTSTANAFSVRDSNGTDRVSIDQAFWFSALSVKANAADNRVLTLSQPDRGRQYGFLYSGNALIFRYFSGGLDAFRIGTDGRFAVSRTGDFTAGAQFPHVGATTPSGGYSGEMRVGNGKLWVNDGGTWRSLPIS
ncbi:MAG TPA: hypothetical protein VF533_04530 [Solirubrobacteraceae bacterium]|jgi:hypothetical protein